MSARSRMTMRASTERQVLSGNAPYSNPYGAPTTALAPIYADPIPAALTWGDNALTWGDNALKWGGGADGLLPCYVQAKVERSITDDRKRPRTSRPTSLRPKGRRPLEGDIFTRGCQPARRHHL